VSGTNARRRGGFAIIIVVSLIAFLGIALATLAAGFTASARLTRGAEDDAQLRQLLLAGERAARQQLSAAGAPSLTLPPELTNREAAVNVEPLADGEPGAFRVEVQLGKRRMAQVVRYTRDGDTWRLVDARLE
jgi:hypothetical protein